MASEHRNTVAFPPMSGRTEPAEPAGSNTGNSTPTPSQSSMPGSKRSASQSQQSPSIPQGRQSTANTLVPYTSPSAGNSPQTSRNTSLVRRDSRPQPFTTPISSIPSAAAIQRALSAATVPQLMSGSVTEAVSRLPRASKSVSGGGSGESTPQWPLSPRLKSPPPSATSSRRTSATGPKIDAVVAPSISVQGPTPQSFTPSPKVITEEPKKVEPQQQLQAPPKALSRGPSGKSTLETVQENSADTISESPAATQASADVKPLVRISEEDRASSKTEGSFSDKQTQPGESGSESAGSKADHARGRRPSSTQPNKAATSSSTTRPSGTVKSSYAPLHSAKSRQAEGKQNMTVETETVASIPQSALNAGDRSGSGLRPDMHGSVRLKPSNETIRPKKERKKPSQKARSINQGTASSKADIFEARVASAVDEANTSDSDETFVYESNPPEARHRPRHHSRTPSVTSSHSTVDQQRGGIRNFGDMLDERRVAGKRSMKFSNNPYHEVDSPDSKNGTVRSHQARHFGKYGRGGSHMSMFDQDSPFTQASKLRSNHMNTRHSRPNSPRSPGSLQQIQQQAQQQQQQQQRPPSGLFGRKTDETFDFDGEGADDERTPLVGTVRTSRNSTRNSRRIPSESVRSIDEYYGVRRRSRCGRFGGYLLGFCVVMAVALGAVAFLVLSNRPMSDVHIREIQNVLASEQEIMLDLCVEAVNPNALGITIGEMDVNVFAKSKHVGSSLDPEVLSNRRRRRRESSKEPPASATSSDPNPGRDLSAHWHAPLSRVDKGTDPIPSNDTDNDLEKDAQAMLLGRIFHFDQVLSFEGSPVKRHTHYSVGELRLMRPGNKTEAGGSARWEKVLQHPFELIVRGVLRYQLPISARWVSVSVGARVMVEVEGGVQRVKVEEEHKEWRPWHGWEKGRRRSGRGVVEAGEG